MATSIMYFVNNFSFYTNEDHSRGAGGGDVYNSLVNIFVIGGQNINLWSTHCIAHCSLHICTRHCTQNNLTGLVFMNVSFKYLMKPLYLPGCVLHLQSLPNPTPDQLNPTNSQALWRLRFLATVVGRTRRNQHARSNLKYFRYHPPPTLTSLN